MKEQSGNRPESRRSRPKRFTAWRKRYVPDSVTLIVVSGLLGIAAGLCAFLLKFLIGHLTDLFTSRLHFAGPNYALLVIPAAGIVLAACYQRYWLRDNLMHGTGRLLKDLRAHRYRLPGRLMYAPMVASTVTLGFGGSAGAEGPIAYTGAAIGSNIGRALGLPAPMLRILIGCGAGAGIAGIFKSPIGGVLFTLEVMKMQLSTLSVLALVGAAVCGSLTCYVCTGFTADVGFFNTTPFDPGWLPWIAGLGLFCGLYSIYYSAVTDGMKRWFGRLRNPWVMNLAGGMILSACVFMFPILYGEGYSTVTRVVNGNFGGLLGGSMLAGLDGDALALTLLMTAVLALKCWATVSSNSAGGVAGDFAPTIFAGAIAGFVYATAMNMLFGAQLPVGIFALLGTAGVFSGAIHAPLMAMFLTAEMADGYGYFLGLAVSAAVSYLTVKLIRPGSVYSTVEHDDIRALLHLGRRQPK